MLHVYFTNVKADCVCIRSYQFNEFSQYKMRTITARIWMHVSKHRQQCELTGLGHWLDKAHRNGTFFPHPVIAMDEIVYLLLVLMDGMLIRTLKRVKYRRS